MAPLYVESEFVNKLLLVGALVTLFLKPTQVVVHQNQN